MVGMELITAIKANDTAVAKQILRDHPQLASERDENGVSAIMNARYRGQTEVVDLLVASGTALDVFEASTLGRVTRVAELLDREPGQVNAVSPDGFTALHLAGFFGQEEVARLLLERGADASSVAQNPMRVQPLHSAVAGRKIEIVRMLLARGAAVNARQQMGWTALHEAANQGNRELVELLLGAGADRAVANDDGKTAIDVARERGHSEVGQMLAHGQSRAAR